MKRKDNKKPDSQNLDSLSLIEQLPTALLINIFYHMNENIGVLFSLSLVSRAFSIAIRHYQCRYISEKPQKERFQQLFWLAMRLMDKKLKLGDQSEEKHSYFEKLDHHLQNLNQENQTKPLEKDYLPELALTLSIIVYLQSDDHYLGQWFLTQFLLKIRYPIFAYTLELFHARMRGNFLSYRTVISSINNEVSTAIYSFKSVNKTQQLLQLIWIESDLFKKSASDIRQSLKRYSFSSKEPSNSLLFSEHRISNFEINQDFLKLYQMYSKCKNQKFLSVLKMLAPYVNIKDPTIRKAIQQLRLTSYPIQTSAIQASSSSVSQFNSSQIEEVLSTLLDALEIPFWSTLIQRMWIALAGRLNEKQISYTLKFLCSGLHNLSALQQSPRTIKLQDSVYIILETLFNSDVPINLEQVKETFLTFLDCLPKLPHPMKMVPVAQAIISRLSTEQTEQLLPTLLQRLQNPNLSNSLLTVMIFWIVLVPKLDQKQVDEILSTLLTLLNSYPANPMLHRILAELATRFNVTQASKVLSRLSSYYPYLDIKEAKKFLCSRPSFIEQLQQAYNEDVTYLKNTQTIVEIVDLHCAAAKKDLQQLQILKNEFEQSYNDPLHFLFNLQSPSIPLFSASPTVEIIENGTKKIIPCSPAWVECLKIFNQYISAAKEKNASEEVEIGTAENNNPSFNPM